MDKLLTFDLDLINTATIEVMVVQTLTVPLGV